MTDQDDKIHNEILDKIKTGRVTMHSRLFLAWRAALWTVGILLLAAAGVFLASFMVFALRASGVWDLPQFGYQGMVKFLAFFPWLFVPAVLMFMWLVQKFVLRFSFAYRLPFLYTSLVVIFLVALGGYLVASTPLHSKLYMFARREKLPGAGRVYKFYGKARPDNFYVGNITAISENSYIMLSREGKQFTVSTSPVTRIFQIGEIDSGDCIEVFGEENEGVISAVMVRTFNSDNPYPFCREPDFDLPPPQPIWP